jgi:hypothetical protein
MEGPERRTYLAKQRAEGERVAKASPDGTLVPSGRRGRSVGTEGAPASRRRSQDQREQRVGIEWMGSS